MAEDLAGAEDGGEVCIENALIFLFRDLKERRGGIGAGAVDEDIDLAGTLEHGFQQGVERLAGRDVDWHEVALAAVGFDFREALLGLFRDSAAEDDLGSGAGEADRHGPAKFTGAADDDGGFSR